MKIKSSLESSKYLDMVEGFEDLKHKGRTNKLATQAMVFIVRGLYSKQKLPLAYFFISVITSCIATSIIASPRLASCILASSILASFSLSSPRLVYLCLASPRLSSPRVYLPFSPLTDNDVHFQETMKI